MPARDHGLSTTREYYVWYTMKERCFRCSHKNYARYGGRGITVCKRWLDFNHFIADMGMRPSQWHTLERRNRNGNYSPSNCYWATRLEQGRNTSRVRLSMELARRIRADRKAGMQLKEIAVKHNVNYNTMTHVIYNQRWRVT